MPFGRAGGLGASKSFGLLAGQLAKSLARGRVAFGATERHTSETEAKLPRNRDGNVLVERPSRFCSIICLLVRFVLYCSFV